jgi:Fur family zinc uptake transcriptional regulator
VRIDPAVTTPQAADPFPGTAHDHARCVSDALAQAVSLCERRGARLTELRRRVLELVWESHAPVGAYEILERLGLERRRAAPPTVYRALDFLSREGLIHRIDSLNAFVGCVEPGSAHRAFFLICRRCRDAVELRDQALEGSLERVATSAGFAVERATVELAGACARCREEA